MYKYIHLYIYIFIHISIHIYIHIYICYIAGNYFVPFNLCRKTGDWKILIDRPGRIFLHFQILENSVRPENAKRRKGIFFPYALHYIMFLGRCQLAIFHSQGFAAVQFFQHFQIIKCFNLLPAHELCICF